MVASFRFCVLVFLGLGAVLPAQVDPSAPVPDSSEPGDLVEVRQRAAILPLYPKFRDVLDILETDAPRLASAVQEVLAARLRREESRGLEFARQHDGELALFLTRLRESRRRAYEGALRELLEDLRYLDQARAEGEEPHRLALRRWKAKTRVRLLAARAARAADAAVEVALEAALVEDESVRREQLQQERARLARRLAQIDGVLAEDLHERVRARRERLRSSTERRIPNGR